MIKKRNKYIILNSGKDFRKISKMMSDLNHPMNHSTARIVVFEALEKLLKGVCERLDITIEEENILELLQRKDVHKMLEDVLFLAFPECKEMSGIKKIIKERKSNELSI